MKLKIAIFVVLALNGLSLLCFDQKVTARVLFDSYRAAELQLQAAQTRAERGFWAKELQEREAQICEKYGDLQAFTARFNSQLDAQADKK